MRDCPTVAPVIGSLQLSDAAPKTNDMLAVSVINPTDGDDDPIEFEYDWYVNSMLMGTATTSSTSNSFDLSQYAFGDKGDGIWVTVTPQDANDVGTPVTSSTATVANSAPTGIGLSANSITEIAPSGTRTACLWPLRLAHAGPLPHQEPALLYYRCMHHHLTGAEKTCFGISGNTLDQLVSGQVLRALEPAGLELSLKARADLRRERERLDKHWKQRLQRARYDVEMTERRYQAVDPTNRLVAATLERQWEESLQNERALKEEYDRHCRQTVPQLGADDEARVTALASDIPALWHASTTTNAERQAIVRCLIERVVVDVEANSEDTAATIHWIGGFESRHEFARPVRTYKQLNEGDLLMKRIIELRDAGKTAEQIADTLNAEGYAPINPGKKFNRDIVRKLQLKLGIYGERDDDSLLGTGEWWVRDLAKEVGIPWQTLREWAMNGWVHARQTSVEKL